MGKTTNDAVNAREKARKRLLALNVERAARDTRIENAAARAITAAERVAAAASDANMARAEARVAYEAALTKIDAAEQSARSKAEPAVTAALVELAAEKLAVGDIAALTDVPLADVRRLLKSAPAPAAAAPVTAPAPEPVLTAPAVPVESVEPLAAVG